MPNVQVNPRAQRSTPDSSDSIAGKALAEALKFLQKEWGWSGKDLSSILHIPVSTINSWLKQASIPVSKPLSLDAQAIITLVAIHKSLNAMFEQAGDQLKWLNTRHPDMGVSPKEKMKKSMEGLIGVRQYLEYVRGRGA